MSACACVCVVLWSLHVYVILNPTWPDERCSDRSQSSLTGMVSETELFFAFGCFSDMQALALPPSSSGRVRCFLFQSHHISFSVLYLQVWRRGEGVGGFLWVLKITQFKAHSPWLRTTGHLLTDWQVSLRANWGWMFSRGGTTEPYKEPRPPFTNAGDNGRTRGTASFPSRARLAVAVRSHLPSCSPR